MRRWRWWAVVGIGVALGVGGVGSAGAQVPEGATSAEEEAWQLNQRVGALLQAGKYDAAIPLARRALAIREKELGPEHLDVAVSLNNLAGIHHARGEYELALPLLQRALSIVEKALDPADPDVARALNNLAGLYQAKGEYERAAPLFLRALSIAENALGPEHPAVATALSNLALLYQMKGERERAEPLCLRALAIREKALGPEHLDVAVSLSNLAGIYLLRGDHERAEPLFQRALSIQQKTRGPDHPEIAASLNNLAVLYRMKGEYDRSAAFYQQVLAILEKTLGPAHQKVASALDNLAILQWSAGRFSDATLLLTRGQDTEEKTLGRILAVGSESQKRDYLATVAGESYAPISLALEARDAPAARLALTTLLRRKGRVLDALTSSLRTLRARLGPEEQTLFDQLDAARSQYVALALRGPGPTPLSAYRARLVALDEQIREREAAISDRSAAFRAEQQPITLAPIQAALPAGVALVEWVVYRPFNPKASMRRESWAPTRYAACVLPKHGDPVWVDLGEEEVINAEIQAFRAALRRPANSELSTPARALEARIMAPVRALLGETRRVFLSPDGALNLVPFAALVGDDGHALVERYAFTYLTSGRDLLRWAAPSPHRGGPLVLANPDFDVPGSSVGAGRFRPLLHAEEEAKTFSRLFAGSTVLLHGQASKEKLKEAQGPRLLHIGTHGYFEPTVCVAEAQKVGEAQKAALDNPLLHSGVALAGANACASGHDEGILTAFEAAGLDLYGTKLAVLSACQTGVGDAKAGDGVYGLRRALVLAGAETQVMSLWPVEGAATATLMKAYYERLGRGEGRSEAMRQVQLAMLHTPGREHPYYWAPFIVSGDDRTLEDKAVVPDLRVHPGGACACRVGGEAPEGQPAWVAVVVALGWMRRRARAGGVASAAQEREITARQGGERP